MQKLPFSIATCILLIILVSCNNKKLEEVVEVPLPTQEEKIIIGTPEDVEADAGAFDLAKLPYQYGDLAPVIDVLTMENHYSKHYLTYTNNLNLIVASNPDLEDLEIEEILKKADVNNLDLRNNAGGYYNHTFFWEGMKPNGTKLKDSLSIVIDRDFGSFENFKNLFVESADKQFGSGWTWLILDKSGNLQITNTNNQDNPLMPKQPISGTPLLNIDVWEHAYYLDYQYKRKKYIEAFFKIINWDKVSERFDDAISKK